MSQLFFGKIGLFTLPVLGVAGKSNSIDCTQTMFDAEAITVQAPAVITDVNTYTWEASADGGITYSTLKDSTNTNIVVPAAGAIVIYNGIFTAITNLRISSSGAITVSTTWRISKAARA